MSFAASRADSATSPEHRLRSWIQNICRTFPGSDDATRRIDERAHAVFVEHTGHALGGTALRRQPGTRKNVCGMRARNALPSSGWVADHRADTGIPFAPMVSAPSLPRAGDMLVCAFA